MIGIAHGYGLGGSGSNLWTREAVSALCNNGETVHLMCQETEPERFDFVTEFIVYDDEGRAERRFQRETTRPGRCVLHKPRLNVLPTYVRSDRPSDYVRSILDLDQDALEEYLARNLTVFQAIGRDHGVRAWHVNHAILLSEALRRLKAIDGTRYAVMPHGSALEYVVRHDPRMQQVARRALDEADAVFSLNQEIRERLARFFPDLELEHKTVTIRVGVDTERFRPAPRDERGARVQALADALHGNPRGHEPRHDDLLEAALNTSADHDAFLAASEPAVDYPAAPDSDVEHALASIRWETERVVTFVGRLIPAKGVGALVAAFPLILQRHPEARLVLVGTGWLREYLQGFLHALAAGDGDRARTILQWSTQRRQEEASPSATTFLDALDRDDAYERYVEVARSVLRPDRVLFTGFLEHHLLAHVFPLADVAVFPSAVPEASPLVIPEAAACGCLPMGTSFAGMKHSLDSLAPRLPDHVARLMRLRPAPEHTAHDIVQNVNEALDLGFDAAPALRRAAVEEYDWRSIADALASRLRALAATG